MTSAIVLKHFDDLSTYRIAPGDTVTLTPLTGPSDGSSTSVFLEAWDPGGQQPDNEHSDSVEIFVFLGGVGQATSDGQTVAVKAGDVLVLPAGSVHHILNISSEQKLYAITIMVNDSGALEGGFEQLVKAGVPASLEDDDRAALVKAARTD